MATSKEESDYRNAMARPQLDDYRNAMARQQLDQINLAANPPIQMGAATIYPPQTAPSISGLVGHAAQGISSTWGNTMAQGKGACSRETAILVEELENGRLVRIGDKRYIVAPGQPLIDVIGQALVELKLEE